MGQWDIHDFLNENRKKWFTARQLSEQLDASFGSVGSSVRKLLKAGLVECKKVKWTTEGMTSSKDVFAYRIKKT